MDPLVWNISWRKKRQPTAIFLPGKSHEQRSLEGYSLQSGKETETTEQLSTHKQHSKNTKVLIIIMYWGFNDKDLSQCNLPLQV